jgi:hypothetical protein
MAIVRFPVPADAMIRDSRPKGSRDLDHVLHFAKRFREPGKASPSHNYDSADCADGARWGWEKNEE